MSNLYPDHFFTCDETTPEFYPDELATQVLLPVWADKGMLENHPVIAQACRHMEKPLYDLRALHTAMVDIVKEDISM
jgi:hypothetical protein